MKLCNLCFVLTEYPKSRHNHHQCLEFMHIKVQGHNKRLKVKHDDVNKGVFFFFYQFSIFLPIKYTKTSKKFTILSCPKTWHITCYLTHHVIEKLPGVKCNIQHASTLGYNRESESKKKLTCVFFYLSPFDIT